MLQDLQLQPEVILSRCGAYRLITEPGLRVFVRYALEAFSVAGF